MARETHPRKLRIVEIVTRRQSASPSEIGDDLGPEWRSPKGAASLRQLLRRMTAGRLLVNGAYGQYCVPSPNAGLQKLDTFHSTENDILAFLREIGGVADTKAIHLAVFGIEAYRARSYLYLLVARVLRESPLFRQDFGHGCWNLAPEQMSAFVVSGRFRFHYMSPDDREATFEATGAALMDARGDLDIHDVAADPAIREAMFRMAVKAPSARAKAMSEHRREIEQRARAEGIVAVDRIQAMVRESKDEIGTILYALFELGDSALHIGASAEFYRACGALFGVSPSHLSRGEIVPE